MSGIREDLIIGDKFSQTFKAFDAAANASIKTAQEFAKALNGFAEGFLDGLTEELGKARKELSGMPGSIHEATDEQEKFKKSVQDTNNAVNDLFSKLQKIATAIGAVKLAEKFIDTSDAMSQITAKLDQINDGSRTTVELQNEIFESAERSRGSFMDTANLVARLGMNAAEAFGSNNEAIQFAENLNKSFKIAGATAQEQASVILQISQALGSGLLRGQEFNAVMAGAPNVMRAIADYMGVTNGKLKEMAADGQITADVVKYALLSATERIDAQFEKMPRTFSDAMTSAKNKIVFAMDGVFEKWSKQLNSAEMQNTIDGIVNVIAKLAEAGGEILVKLAEGATWVADNWSDIAPIIEVVIGAVLTYKAASLITAAATGAAWLASHAPLLAIGGIFLALIAGADAMGADFQDIAGAIGRVFGVVIAGIYNGFVDVFNLIRDIKGEGEITGSSFADTLYDSVIHPAMGAVAGITDAFGVGEAAMTDIIANSKSNVVSHLQGVYKGKSISQTLDEADKMAEQLDTGRLEHISYDVAATTGEQIGRNFGGSVNNLISKFESLFSAAGGDTGSIPQDADWYALYYGGVKPKDKYSFEIPTYEDLLKDIVTDGVKVKGEVKLAEEDIKMFRDIAENRYIANVSLETLAPSVNVNVENNGQNLSGDVIADAVTEALVTQISEHTAISHG